MRDSEILVLGGGPSGLLIASCLAPEYDITLLERGKVGETEKFWISTNEKLAAHDLTPFVVYRTTRGTVGTFLGRRVVAEGDFSVLDEEGLLRELRRRCESRGVQILEDTPAKNVSWRTERVEIRTPQEVFSTRLAIDATGGMSPIVAAFRQHHIDGFYSIFGEHLQGITLKTGDIVGAEVLTLSRDPLFFEVVPTGTDSAHVVLFQAVERLRPPEDLQGEYEEHVSSNPFFEISAQTEVSPKLGVIPIGRTSKRALPGVLSVGEAGMVQAPLLGTAFNEVLDTAPRIVEAVHESFEETKDGIVSPRPKFSLQKRLNDRLQRKLAHYLLQNGLEGFERLVRFLGNLGPQRAYRLFASRLSGTDWWSVTRAGVVARLGRKQLSPDELRQDLTGD